jgi:Trans-aconitate methyltransferase
MGCDGLGGERPNDKSWGRDQRGRLSIPRYLSEEEIAKSDEYSEGDPYSVEDRLDSPFHRRRFNLTLELLRDVAPFKHLLDVGCGEGHITAEIKKRFPEAEIHALDYSISAIRKAHRKYPGIHFAVGDAVKSRYPAGPFDVIVCNNLWEHVTNPVDLLQRMKDVLKPNGAVIISTPSRYRTDNLVRVFLGKEVKFMSKLHVTEYTVGQVKEQLTFGGFEVQKIISRPINTGSMKFRTAHKMLELFCSTIKSHHQLESTIFYLARLK